MLPDVLKAQGLLGRFQVDEVLRLFFLFASLEVYELLDFFTVLIGNNV